MNAVAGLSKLLRKRGNTKVEKDLNNGIVRYKSIGFNDYEPKLLEERKMMELLNAKSQAIR